MGREFLAGWLGYVEFYFVMHEMRDQPRSWDSFSMAENKDTAE